MTEHPHVHAGTIPADQVPGGAAPGVDLPEVESQHLMLLDDDNGNCTPISPHGFAPWYPPYDPSYVDNVAGFAFRPSDPFGFSGIENDPIHVTLVGGEQVSIPRNWIARDAGSPAEAYRRMQRVTYPADAGYTVTLNETNTPNLVSIDNYILALTQVAAAERYEIAEIVSEFSGAIAALGQAGGQSEEIRQHVEHFGRRAHE